SNDQLICVDFDPTSRETSLHDCPHRFESEFGDRFAVSGTVVGIPNRDEVYLWDFAKGRTIQTLHARPSPNPSNAVALSPDGRYVASTADSVWLWEVASGKRLHEFKPPATVLTRWGGYFPNACTFSPDSKSLAVANRGGAVLLFDVPGGTLRLLKEHTDQSS